MNIYTKTKEVNYNSLIEVISNTGMPMDALTFEGMLGLFEDITAVDDYIASL